MSDDATFVSADGVVAMRVDDGMPVTPLIPEVTLGKGRWMVTTVNGEKSTVAYVTVR